MITYYVVQSFYVDQHHRMQPDEPILAKSEDHARVTAESLSEKKAGVVAFSRKADQAAGEYEDAVVLIQFGHIPFEDAMLEMAS